ncbi:MAG TPA: hypothetical protein VFW12_05965 [Candidatus Limnocylindria bacterium]|nr:hypothetical protein [Candidatus Limnocylindria bacterium]
MRDAVIALIACVALVAITFFEQIPVWGWLGGAISVGVWWLLGREMSGALAAAFMGAVSGFLGALTSWAAQTGNLFGFTTPPGDRFGALFGFIGSSLGILYWPVVGAAVAGAAALFASRRTGSRDADPPRAREVEP